MASTRNINTLGNYCMEQNQYANSSRWSLYPQSSSGYAYHTGIPGNGLLPGQINSSELSYNNTNIESFLFGINLTNLTKQELPCLTPEIKKLEQVNIFPNTPTYIPEKLVVSKNNRPFEY
jgi:hypothetical protein